MKININQQIKIKLTKNGKDVYRNYLHQFRGGQNISQEVPEELQLPLWEFAQIFGNEFFNGNPRAPFTIHNEIELID